MTFQQELNQSLHDHGHLTAIEYAGTQISYAALAAKAAMITRWLLKKKTGPVIGILLRNKADLIASIIGTVNARCIFVPLDNALPEKRLDVMLRDLRPACILCSKTDGPSPAAVGDTPVCYLEDITASRVRKKDRDLLPAFDPEDSLYVYFTSGSTGIPKGIIGKNGGLLQFLRWEIREFSIDKPARFSQFISPWFDAFLRDVFVPLLTGGTICVPPGDDDFFTPEKMRSWINANHIHLIHCVPSVFRIFNSRSLSPEDYQDLRYVLLSGEKIVPPELAGWYDTLGSRVQLVNLYGATETTMIRTCYRIRPEDVNRTKIPIGTPIAGTELLIAREDGSPCGPLVTGDLYIISPYVTKGYLNAPGLTHQRFLHSGPGSPTAIAFRTGDKARWTAGGEVDLLGRADRQIKLRGVRIEPDEIEHALIQWGGLRQAVVLLSKPDGEGEEGTDTLVAFVIRREGLPVQMDLMGDLTGYLKQHLPDYMIPPRIVELEQYPQLPNGKIDVQALLAIPAAHPLVAPANELEEKILLLWKEILGEKPISTTDSFLSVGGTSISIMRLIARLYKTFNTRIALSDLFANLTVSTQADLVRRLAADNALKITKAAIKPDYHLSAVQERLYAHNEKNKQNTAFNLPMAWETDDRLDTASLEAILLQLIRRHESLRTEFRFVDGQLRQIVRDQVDFHVEDLGSCGKNLGQAIALFVRPFDLGVAPLIRCGILSCTDGKKLVIVDLHHIICDGTSQVILLSEFLSLHSGESPDPPQYQYRDYAEWEHHFRSTEDYTRQREYWLKLFEGPLPVLELPVSSLQGREDSNEGATVFFRLEKAAWQPIFSHLQKDEVTHFSIWFSVFFLFLAQLTGQEDIVIGTNSSGRIQEELSDVIGMFVKSLPIRYQLDADMPFRQFVREMHSLLVEAQSRQIYDLADILRDLSAGRENPVNSLFDAMFVFLNFDDRNIGTSEELFLKYEFEQRTSKYPITLFAGEGGQSVNFRLEYSTRYFTKSDAELLTLRFRRLCRKIAEAPEARVISYFGDAVPADLPEKDTISFTF
jgi:mycobactin peptide synthetase MbtE